MNINNTSLHRVLLVLAMGLPLGSHALPLAAPDGADLPPPAACADQHEAHGARGMGPGGERLRGIPPPPGMPPLGGPGMAGGEPPVLRGVDLSEAQQDKVFAILHAEAPYVREQLKAGGKAQEALHAMSAGGQFDDAKAAALAQAGAQAMANLALQHIRTDQKLLALLTPEQRKQLAEDRSRHPARL